MIDKAIEEFKHQFCDWNKPSIFVNSKTQPKMDFLRKKLKEMRDACAKIADMESENEPDKPNPSDDWKESAAYIAKNIRKIGREQ